MIIPILTIKPLSEQAAYLIPVAVIASFVVALPVAWIIAPRMRVRYWKKHGKDPWGIEEGPFPG